MISDKPWRPEHVLQLLVRLFGSMFVGMILISWVNSTSYLHGDVVKVLTLAVGTLSFHGIALVLTHLFLREQAIRWEDAFGLFAPRPGRTLGLALLVGIAVLPIAWSLGQLSAKVMTTFHFEPVVQGPVQMLQGVTTIQTKLLIGFLAIVIAPVAEEVIFRGIIYPTLKQHGFPQLALWGTSLLFAAIHNNLMILLPLTFLAVVLTLLYEATDNLLAPIFAHSLFNFVNFFWVVAQPVTSTLSWQ